MMKIRFTLLLLANFLVIGGCAKKAERADGQPQPTDSAESGMEQSNSVPESGTLPDELTVTPDATAPPSVAIPTPTETESPVVQADSEPIQEPVQDAEAHQEADGSSQSVLQSLGKAVSTGVRRTVLDQGGQTSTE